MESGPPVGQIYTMYIEFPLMGIPYPINQAAVAPHFQPASTKGALGGRSKFLGWGAFRHFQKQVAFCSWRPGDFCLGGVETPEAWKALDWRLVRWQKFLEFLKGR